MDENLKEISSILDDLLAKADISETTQDNSNNILPDGYYLCEVESAVLDKSSGGHPIVKFRYKIIENGFKLGIDEEGNEVLSEAKGTINNSIFINYVLATEQQLNFFVSDMLKFEDPSTEMPLLEKEYFKTTALLLDALDILKEGSRIYIMVQSKESRKEPGKIEKKYNPITWKRAKMLNLI